MNVHEVGRSHTGEWHRQLKFTHLVGSATNVTSLTENTPFMGI